MKVAVIGSGAWGTALAIIAFRAGNQVKIWSRDEHVCYDINFKHKNSKHLQDIKLPSSIKAISNLKDVLDSEIILLATPAQTTRSICEELKRENIPSNKILIACAKGIERNSLKLMSEVIDEILPENKVAVLSGPNFAMQIAQGMPAISSISSSDLELAQELAKIIGNPFFRIYPNQDIIGTQIFGAAKNVLAIATGIVIGKKLGENTKSAVFSRGIYEINNLVIAKGGSLETLLSPAGLGDLNLTCGSITSRNTSYGVAIAEDKHLEFQILAEGFYTAESIVLLAKSLKVNMPIAESIYKIIEQNYPVDSVIAELLSRPL